MDIKPTAYRLNAKRRILVFLTAGKLRIAGIGKLMAELSVRIKKRGIGEFRGI